jgi:sugar lactone lactonase YvrE
VTTAPAVEIVAKNPDVVGENPLWRSEEGRIYWTDNRSKRVYRMRPGDAGPETVVDGEQAYAFTFNQGVGQRDASLLLFLSDTGIAVATDGGVRHAIDALPGQEGSRFNDVLADGAGRVICGIVTASPTAGKAGSLYSLDTDGQASMLAGGLSMPNGMAFSANDDQMYVADTTAQRVLLYDYDVVTGTVANERMFLDLSSEEGRPDGITVDAEGCLWVAMSGGWCVVRYDDRGGERERITFPARKITSICFGDEALDTLYVTSSSRESVPDEEIGLEGGALFALRPGVTGLLDHRSNVNI